ncbi:PAQR family membrane homeostasis protein TrhA [Oribacterium sp. WCC10]|uniref:PAQR family membrane homeostasis protein TrhA n=1 Tax=Oribacterium sp. WCC10 TaxID=1855343 RepID=UPI0008E6978F|nr:hemolysin III family protein [Oribacterium sp. WCC10]SFG47589.1 hemolysin III [Oribacterium sp. WCC10]
MHFKDNSLLLKIKDPGSFLTHYIAMILSIFAAVPLFYRVAQHPSIERILAFGIFALSIVLLYAASATYHLFDISPKVNDTLKKIDHMMIYMLIAGSYTPVCAIALGDSTGWGLLAIVWILSVIGMTVNIIFIHTPKWLNSIIYIALGWACIFAIFKIKTALTGPEFWLLFAGGVIYTIGGVIYALKLPIFKHLPGYFGNHEIFHCFVIAGSMCHYGMMIMLAG